MSCPICRASAAPYVTHGENRLVRCTGCGLVYMDPPPPPAAIHALYDDTYNGAQGSYFTKVDRKLKRSRGRVQKLVRLLGGAAGKSFLDVGSNGGFMVEAAREAGFKASGLEPDGPSIAWAREHFPANRYLHGLLEETDLKGETFDAIYCSEVIEHAPDCNRFVAALAAALAPGGLLYLTTPDIGHWRRPREITRWDAFCPPSHCIYFSPANLAQLLEQHGLSVVWRALSFKPGIKLVARKRASTVPATRAA